MIKTMIFCRYKTTSGCVVINFKVYILANRKGHSRKPSLVSGGQMNKKKKIKNNNENKNYSKR